jgi:hypothetical protein
MSYVAKERRVMVQKLRETIDGCRKLLQELNNAMNKRVNNANRRKLFRIAEENGGKSIASSDWVGNSSFIQADINNSSNYNECHYLQSKFFNRAKKFNQQLSGYCAYPYLDVKCLFCNFIFL